MRLSSHHTIFKQNLMRFLERVKYFGLRKIYYIIRNTFIFIVYPITPYRIVFDLKFIPQEKKDEIKKKVITRLSKFNSVSAIIDYGGTRTYLPGISDIDFMIIIKDKHTYVSDILAITKILKENDNLFYLHPPLFAESYLFKHVVISAFNADVLFDIHNKDSGKTMAIKSKVFKVLYKQKSFNMPTLTLNRMQKLLFSLEKHSIKLVLNNFTKKRNFNQFGTRTIIKSLKNAIFFELKLLHNLAKVYPFLSINIPSFEIENLEKDIKQIIHEIIREKRINAKIQESIKDISSRVNTILDLYCEQILECKEFNLLDNFYMKKNVNLKMIKHDWGTIIFMKNFYMNKSNILIKLLQLFGVNFFDMKFYHYLLALENPEFVKRVAKLKGDNSVRNIWDRSLLLDKWWNYINNNNLMEYSDYPIVLTFIKKINKLSYVDQQIEKIFNFLYSISSNQ